MSVCVLVCLFMLISESLSVYLSVCLSVCLSVSLSVWQCLSVCFRVVSGLNCLQDLGLSYIKDVTDVAFSEPCLWLSMMTISGFMLVTQSAGGMVPPPVVSQPAPGDTYINLFQKAKILD